MTSGSGRSSRRSGEVVEAVRAPLRGLAGGERTVSDVAYRSVDAADVMSVAALVGDVFSCHEPLATAAGQSAADIVRIASSFGRKAVRERLAFMAIDTGTGAIVGAALAHDFGTPPPADLVDLGAGSRPILALLDELEAVYRRSRSIEMGQVAHILMIAVSPAFAGQGIARRLLQRVLLDATARGYRFAFTEATSAGSQRVFQGAGFREITAAPYATFEFEGSRPFASIASPGGALLMERQL